MRTVKSCEQTYIQSQWHLDSNYRVTRMLFVYSLSYYGIEYTYAHSKVL